ncbi:MAG: hypothetical protein WCJ49_09265, partial [Deltaproteobacteria bacterium]
MSLRWGRRNTIANLIARAEGQLLVWGGAGARDHALLQPREAPAAAPHRRHRVVVVRNIGTRGG